MSFAVVADAYDRFMGRYSVPLAPELADFAAVAPGQRVLDVGCGPGALTAELVMRLGAAAVSAVDPSEPFVAAVQERHPGVSVQHAAAEQLPFGDQEFDAALAQLAVHFMAHPVVGLREMARVTRKHGVVARVFGITLAVRGRSTCFGRRRASLIQTWRMSPGLRVPARATLRSYSKQPGCTRSRRALCQLASSIRASRNGGSRSRSAWAPLAATRLGSTRSGEPSCANSAARCWQQHRSY